MSAEFNSSNNERGIDRIAYDLQRGLRTSHPSNLYQEALKLTRDSTYDPADVLRTVAGVVLAGDDNQLHNRVLHYFEWESGRYPQASSAALLISRASADMLNEDRLTMGMKKIKAAADYIDKAIQTSAEYDDDYTARLVDLLRTLHDNNGLLAEEYAGVAMRFRDHAFDLASQVPSLGVRSQDKISKIDELLAYISIATDEQDPVTAKMARDRITIQPWREAAEMYKMNREVWNSLSDFDFVEVGRKLSQKQYEINEHVWSKMAGAYGVGSYDQEWVSKFVDVIDVHRPAYFTEQTQYMSSSNEYSHSLGYVLGCAAQYEVIDRMFPESQQLDVESVSEIALQVAEAYGETEDYRGIDRLLKRNCFTNELIEMLIEHFSIGREKAQLLRGL